jgi:glycosyltransferase involved in cell wall biosynthesis
MTEPVPELDAISTSGPVVVIIGSLLRWKGQATFIDAAAIIARSGSVPNVSFWIVGGSVGGEDDYELELRERVVELGLQDSVRFAGHCNNVFPWIGRADVVVHASVNPEPFGRVIIEGMALGKPVIASRLGGPVEIISDGQSGLLVDPGKPELLAEAIVKVLTDEALRRTLTEGGYKTVHHKFSMEAFKAKVRLGYESILPATAEVPPAASRRSA